MLLAFLHIYHKRGWLHLSEPELPENLHVLCLVQDHVSDFIGLVCRHVLQGVNMAQRLFVQQDELVGPRDLLMINCGRGGGHK